LPVEIRDLGILGVIVHIVGDALNNVGVVIAALVIWLAKPDSRFSADPGVSLAITLMIIASSFPLGIVAS
jgi:zinc transporter 1